MRIELFEHNQTAYQAALDMLQTAGKAVIVHPTGSHLSDLNCVKISRTK